MSSKSKFDENKLNGLESSDALEPIDFMRPMVDAPATQEPLPEGRATKPRNAKRPSTEHPAISDELAMPESRDRTELVQINTRQPKPLSDRLDAFNHDHHSTSQDAVTIALEDFLTRRGY